MYNRVLKRPMFRKGGPAVQGTGIMSHVEPRKNFRDGTPWKVAEGPVTFEAIKQGNVGLPQLTREEVEQMLYAGKPVSEPSTAEKALLIAQIAGTPGGLYEKIKASLPTTAGILAKQREKVEKRDEKVGEVMAKQNLEERLQQIKANVPGTTQENARAQFNAMTKGLQRVEVDGKIYFRDPKTGESKPQLFYEREALDIANRTPGFYSSRALEQVSAREFEKSDKAKKLQGEIARNRTKVDEYQRLVDKNPKNKDAITNLESAKAKLEKTQSNYNNLRQQTVTDRLKTEEGLITLPGDLEQKAKGGRIGFADGSEDPEDSEDITETQTAQTRPVNEPSKLTVQQLRQLLPPEVGDDVINLLSTSTEALYDFANIVDSNDVMLFNKKYGTNINLPQKQAQVTQPQV